MEAVLGEWAVIHLFRFEVEQPVEHLRELAGSPQALSLVLGADALPGDDGFLQPGPHRVWAGLSMHGSRAAAEAEWEAHGSPRSPHGLAESWHALLRPYKHWGETDWLGPDRIGPAFAVPRGQGAPDGPIAVTTSAGYEARPDFDFERLRRFIAGIQRVRAQLSHTDGVRAHMSCSNPDLMREGLTFSLWRDETALTAFAYRPSVHREELDIHRRSGQADRTAFTRYAVVRSCGTWDGEDPVASLRGS